ncbi:phenylacetate--CoA ligase family protein [Tenacibaculum halocynthiae]|uniref:phenylacetate--CoA ligase family protein n=1 Tax=Tenacibaculum halocynthiae TaxID=1254437 RepID=UPI003896591A
MIPKIEQASLSEIKIFQEKKMRTLLSYLEENSKFYQKRFKDNSIDIFTIKTVEDLEKIPVTTKEDLQINNEDFICVKKEEIIDIVTTSGTLGDPVTFMLSNNDLDRLSYNEYISFACAGITNKDVVQLTTTLDKRFMAGLAYFLGIRKLGASVIRTGVGSPELQWDSIIRLKPTCLVVVPSFLLKLISYAKKHQINLKEVSVQKAVCIGEPVRNQNFTLNALAKKIKEEWDIELFSTYASTEMSTAFTDCKEKNGGHHHPELIITELLDENNKPVKEGEPGELTITTLGVETMPLLRYKTGDVVTIHNEPCKCGRNTYRIGSVLGRKKQMIKLKGTTIFPEAIKSVLNEFNEIINFVIEIYHNEIDTDEVVLKIETNSDEGKLKTRVAERCKTKLRVVPHIEFTSKDEIQKLRFPKLSRKPVDIIDKRIT